MIRRASTMDHYNQLVGHVKKYVELSQADIALLESYFEVRFLKKKELYLKEGQVSRHCAYVTQGCFRMFSVDEQGKEHINRFALEDWWIGDLRSFIMQEPAIFYIEALENSSVVQISYEKLEVLFTKAPVMERFFRIAYQRSLASVLAQKDQMISLSGEERYFAFIKTYPDIEQRVPQYMIASYLGLTPVFVSNIRRKR